MHVLMRSLALLLVAAACLAGCGAPRPAAAPTTATAHPAAGRLEPSAPHELRARSADGVELAVSERGPRGAPSIVFIHGLGFSREAWHRQLAGPLASRHHLVAYDLRGHGRSSRPTETSAYADGERWADDLAAVLRATQARRPVLVGWSLGGLVMGHYLRVHGDGAIGGLVFVDAVTRLAPEVFTPGNAVYLRGLDDARDDVRAAATDRFLRACFATPLPDAEMAMLTRAAGVLPAFEHAAIQRMASEGMEAALRGVRVPTRIVHGALDAFVAEAMARYTERTVPGARMTLYAGSGHAPFLEENVRFDAELATFVEQTAGAAAGREVQLGSTPHR